MGWRHHGDEYVCRCPCASVQACQLHVSAGVLSRTKLCSQLDSPQNNTYGQLGNGGDDSQRAPVAVLGGHTFSSISAGAYHTCAIDKDGALWCWGYRWSNGQDDSTSVPEKVGGGHTWKAVTAGFSTCALDRSGDVWCFGESGGQRALSASWDAAVVALRTASAFLVRCRKGSKGRAGRWRHRTP